MYRFILASASPRRKELLSQVGIEFEVIKSDVEEIITHTEPDEVVIELSRQKAEDVYENHLKIKEDSLVIGADTVVAVNGRILGKPKDQEDAFRMLSDIAGGSHFVYTGVTLIINSEYVSFSVATKVDVYEMSDEEIWRYIRTGEPMDKAGAYGIQGMFAAFVKGIEGDYNNVVGLPVGRICEELRNRKVDFQNEV